MLIVSMKSQYAAITLRTRDFKKWVLSKLKKPFNGDKWGRSVRKVAMLKIQRINKSFQTKGKLYKMKRGRKDKFTILARDFKTSVSVVGRVDKIRKFD